ncbi:YmaF family protein [Brevibacillus sp. NRS-1366]|uniref:YmaF family protein n=1 Tax=Brevibacillus sp. NRS-1366 TaxID=3233899 RepID=UPI003D1E7070
MKKRAKNHLKWKLKKKSTGTRQRHVHEFLGSTRLAEEGDERHNHRFAGVTGQAIPRGNSHVHIIRTNTDFFDHFHQVRIVTGPAIPVGNGKHVHFVKGSTTFEDGHVHVFRFATLIQKPLL